MLRMSGAKLLLVFCATAISLSLAAQTRMAIRHVAPLSAVANQPLILSATITGDVGETTVQLYYRTGERANYRSLDMTRTLASSYLVTIPTSQLDAGVLEYYIVAVNQAGQMVRLASEDVPLSVPVTATTVDSPRAVKLTTEEPGADRKPWYTKWWVWTILGGAAAGGAAGGAGGDGGDGHPGMVH